MSRLLLYHDFSSPFSRLAGQIVPEAARRAGLELWPIPLELFPAPVPLPAPEEAFADELATAREFAAAEDLRLGELRRVPRTRKAHEAVAFARGQGRAVPVLNGLYDALWDDDRDIARLDVLVDVGATAGVDRDALHIALGLDEHTAEVAREQEAVTAGGLTGVPAVQLGDALAVGLLPLRELMTWIEETR